MDGVFPSAFNVGRRAAALTLVSGALTAFAGAAQASAPFACHAQPTQRCYFAVLHADGRRVDFVLAPNQVRVVDDAVAGADRYMASVNFAPPANPESCSRSPRIGARRSWWCKLEPVKAEGND
jgi:hypothetical protein